MRSCRWRAWQPSGSASHTPTSCRTSAVFVALGGSSYAALQIDSADIVNNSVRELTCATAHSVKRHQGNALGGRAIREFRLGRVPRARTADRLGGVSAAELLLACPSGIYAVADVCVETVARPAVSLGVAIARA